MQCSRCLVVLSHQTSTYEVHLSKCSAFRYPNAFKTLSLMSSSSHQSVAIAGLGGSSTTLETPDNQASPARHVGPSNSEVFSSPFRPHFEIVCPCCPL
jgi:hypothetical protein